MSKHGVRVLIIIITSVLVAIGVGLAVVFGVLGKRANTDIPIVEDPIPVGAVEVVPVLGGGLTNDKKNYYFWTDHGFATVIDTYTETGISHVYVVTAKEKKIEDFKQEDLLKVAELRDLHFNGWYLDSARTKQMSVDEVTADETVDTYGNAYTRRIQFATEDVMLRNAQIIYAKLTNVYTLTVYKGFTTGGVLDNPQEQIYFKRVLDGAQWTTEFMTEHMEEDHFGFEFDAWYSNPEHSNEFEFVPGFDDEFTMSSNIKIYAKWDRKSYNVIYNFNVEEDSDYPAYLNVGGQVYSRSYTTKVYHGYTASSEIVPTRSAYLLDDWYYMYRENEEDKIARDPFDNPIVGDREIFANWRAAITLKFVTEKNEGRPDIVLQSSITDLTIDHGDAISSNKWNEMKEASARGYVLQNWYILKDGQKIIVIGEELSETGEVNNSPTLFGEELAPNEPKTQNVYSSWELLEYNLYVYPNVEYQSGSTLDTTLISAGFTYDSSRARYAKVYTVESATITLPTSAQVSKLGYVFASWYKDASFSGTSTATIEGGQIGDTSLYLKWTIQNYLLTFYPEGGSFIDGYAYANGLTLRTGTATRYEKNYQVTSPTQNFATSAEISKAGYTFIGWFEKIGDRYYGTNGEGYANITDSNLNSGNAFTQLPTANTGAKNFYAKWAIINYDVSYNLSSMGTEFFRSEAELPVWGTSGNQNRQYTIESPTFTFPTTSAAQIVVPEGYEFVGWFEYRSGKYYDKNGVEYESLNNAGLTTANRISSVDKGSTGNRVFHAKFNIVTKKLILNVSGGTLDKLNYTNNLTYVQNGNNYEATVAVKNTVGAGYEVALPNSSEISKAGYTFTGWNRSGPIIIVTSVSWSTLKAATESVTYIANWEAIEYDVEYVVDGSMGSVPSAAVEKYKITDKLTLPSATTMNNSSGEHVFKGYKFIGWFEKRADNKYYDKNGVGYDELSTSELTASNAITEMPVESTGNRVFHAKIEVIEYSIEYKFVNPSLNSFTITDSSLVKWASVDVVVRTFTINSTSITLNNDMVATVGYSLNNWSASASGAAITQINSGLVPADKNVTTITVFMQVQPITYSITYYGTTGNVLSGITPTTYTIEQTITLPIITADKGYSFWGWFEYKDGKYYGTGETGYDNLYDDGLSYDNDITGIAADNTGDKQFYAKQGLEYYDLTLDFARDGVTIGWGTGTSYDGLTYSIIADSNKYTAGYDVTKFGTDNIIGFVSPSKLGYTFIGWFEKIGVQYYGTNGVGYSSITNTNLSAENAFVGLTKDSDYGDKEFVAKWEIINRNITLDLNGGSLSTTSINGVNYSGTSGSGYMGPYNIETASVGNNISLPSDTYIYRLGYTFIGWFEYKDGKYYDENGAEYTDLLSASLNSDNAISGFDKTTLLDRSYVAKWEVILYDIEYGFEIGDVSGGISATSGTVSVTAGYGALRTAFSVDNNNSLTAKNLPNKDQLTIIEDYKFVGWFEYKDGKYYDRNGVAYDSLMDPKLNYDNSIISISYSNYASNPSILRDYNYVLKLRFANNILDYNVYNPITDTWTKQAIASTSMEKVKYKSAGAFIDITDIYNFNSSEYKDFILSGWYNDESLLTLLGSMSDIVQTPIDETFTVYSRWVSADVNFNFAEGSSKTVINSLTSVGQTRTSIIIPNGVTTIISLSSSNLENIFIPASVTDIAEGAFAGCSNLNNIVVDSGNTHFTVVDGVLFKIEGSSRVLHTYTARKTGWSYTLPNDVSRVADKAFVDNTFITTFTVPNTNTVFTAIGASAFAGTAMQTVNILSATDISIGEKAFLNSADFQSLQFGANTNVVSIGGTAFKGTSLSTITNKAGSNTLPMNSRSATTLTIGEGAFEGLSTLTSLEITTSTHNLNIGNRVFAGTLLKAIVLPSNTATLGENILAGCGELVVVYINSENLTSSSNLSAFMGIGSSSNRTHIYVPENKVISYETIFTNGNISIYANHYDLLTFTHTPATQTSTLTGASAMSSVRSDLIVPKYTPQGYTVTTINARAFQGNTYIRKVTLFDSVTTMGTQAFEGSSLAEITIPNSVTSIAEYTFRNCSSLTDVTLSSTLTAIGQYAFYGATALQSITIPALVTSIGQYAFASSGTKMTLNSVTFLGTAITSLSEGLFDNASLTSVSIPSSVITIEKYAFRNNAGLDTVTFSGVLLASIGESSFEGCRLSSITLPNGLTQIGKTAFKNTTGLGVLSIPNSVTTIGENAFEGSSITSVSIGSGLTTIGNYAFYQTYNLGTITVSASNTKFYATSNVLYEKLTGDNVSIAWYPSQKSDPVFTVTENVRAIRDGVFSYNSYLKQINAEYIAGSGNDLSSYSNTNTFTINELTKIYVATESLSYYRSRLTRVSHLIEADETVYFTHSISGTTPKTATVTGLTERGRSRLTNNSTLTIPDNFRGITVTTVGASAFENLDITNSVTVPTSVTSIGAYAFRNAKVTRVTMQQSTNEIALGTSVFASNTTLTEVTINRKLLSVPQSAFEGCTTLTTVLVDNITGAINTRAFYGCTNLATIQVTSNNISAIGNDAFYNTSNLKRLASTIDGLYQLSNVATVGDRAFYGNSQLRALNVTTSLTTVGNQAFYNCVLLKSIGSSFSNNLVLPLGLTSIGNQAFAVSSGNATAYTVVSLPASVTSMGYSLFENATSLTSLQVPFVGVNSTNNRVMAYFFKNSTSYTDNPTVVPTTLQTVIVAPQTAGNIGIANYAFYNCEYITSVELRAGVTSVGTYAFSNVTPRTQRLSSVILADTIKTIGSYAFRYCAQLTNITLPSNQDFKIIASYVFQGTGLTSLSIPANVTTIESYAFAGIYAITISDVVYYQASMLKTITFAGGSKLETIGTYAFAYNGALESIKVSGSSDNRFPDGLTSIGQGAFLGDTTMETDDVGNSFTYPLKDIIIPVSVNKSMGLGIFQNSKLEKISLPYVGGMSGTSTYYHLGFIFGTTSASSNSSYVPQTLKEVVLLDNPEIDILGHNSSVSGFYYCYYIEKVTVPASIRTIGYRAFSYTGNNIAEGKNFIVDFATNAVGNSFITDICSYAFAYNYKLPSLDLSAMTGLTRIQSYAFQSCRMTSIKLPYSLLTIENGVFSGCSYLKTVEIEKNLAGNINLQKIGDRAFEYASSLDNIGNFESFNNLREIGSYAFAYCYALNIPKLPTTNYSGGLTLKDWAFTNMNSSNFTSVEIPGGVNSIAPTAFADVSNLSAINVLISNSKYSSLDGVLFSKDKKELITYPKARYAYDNPSNPSSSNYYKIPVGVTHIEEYAFYNNLRLATIDLDNGALEKIDQYSMFGCSQLRTITIPTTVTTISELAFSKSVSVTYAEGERDDSQSNYLVIEGVVYILNREEGTASLSYFPASDSRNRTSYNVGGKITSSTGIEFTVTSVGDYAFFGTKLTTINIGTSIESIGGYAFANNSGSTVNPALTINFAVGSKLKTIGEYAFNYNRSNTLDLRNCTQLQSIEQFAFTYSQMRTINLPTTSTLTLGASVFSSSRLTTLTLPSGVKSIPVSAFAASYYLETIIVNKEVQSINSYAFSNVGSSLPTGTYPTITFEIGSQLISIGSYSFQSARYKILDLGNCANLKVIGDWALSYMYYTEEINLPASIETIGTYTFYYTGSQTTNSAGTIINFAPNSSLNRIDRYAFYNSRVKTLDLRNCTELGRNSNNKSYAEYAFYYAINLETVFMPQGMLYLSNYMFYYARASNLNIVFANNSELLEIGPSAFYNDYQTTGLTSINLEACAQLRIIESSAFYYTNLTTVTLPASLEIINGNAFAYVSQNSSFSIIMPVNSQLKTVGSSAFAYSGLTTIDLRNCTLLTTLSYSFQNATKLTTVWLPTSITSISSYAFYNCTALTGIYITRSVLPVITLTTSAFTGTNANLKIYVPQSLLNNYKSASGWSSHSSKIIGV